MNATRPEDEDDDNDGGESFFFVSLLFVACLFIAACCIWTFKRKLEIPLTEATPAPVEVNPNARSRAVALFPNTIVDLPTAKPTDDLEEQKSERHLPRAVAADHVPVATPQPHATL